MKISSLCLLGVALSISSFATAEIASYGPLFQSAPYAASLPQGPRKGLDAIRRWNQISIDASGLDHTPPAPGENRVFHEQLGPGRASRAIAIVHIAMFDAVNAIDGKYQSYTGLPRVSRHTSMSAAIAQAAHDTLVAMFP